MSRQFSQQEFANALLKKCPAPQDCPFCGGNSYKTYSKITQLQIQSNLDGITFGQSIPCGVLICETCGHINLFALGALGFKL